MAVTITRTPWIDDDGTGTTGTVINNAVKTALYNEIDAALAALAPIASPALTGVPTAPTAAPGTNTTQIATTAYVQAITSGTVSGQVPFPAIQNPSANPNTLDDYEEGTWTPTLGGQTSTSGQAYSARIGNYTKIGRLVTCTFLVTLSAKGTLTGNLAVTGLPFPSGVSDYGSFTVEYWNALATPLVHLSGFVGANMLFLYGLATAATAVVALTGADLTDTSDLRGSITYFSS